MASYINMESKSKSLADAQDSRIGVRPLAVWKGFLACPLIYIFIFSYRDTNNCIFMDNGEKQFLILTYLSYEELESMTIFRY